MHSATDQFAEISKANAANVVKLASLSLEKAERLAKLSLQSAKVALEQSASNAYAIVGVKDVEELFALREKLSETGVQYATAYSRGIFEIASETQAELSALAEEAWTNYTKSVEAWIVKAGKDAPAGSDIVVGALKSTTAVFDQLSKATQQFMNFGDASLRATKPANEAKATSRARKTA